jgi:P-type Cu+ transporter
MAEGSVGAAGATAVVELAVTGMHCPSCVALVEETLVGAPGVAEATVDLEAGRASVVFRPDAVSVDALCAAILGAGYGAEATSSPRPAP